MLDLVLRRSLPLFVLCAAAIYFGLIRDRRWRVGHYSKRGRAAHYWICLGFAAAVTCAIVYPLGDEIACPQGGAAELAHTHSNGKGGVTIRCRSTEGRTTDGSLFALLFALFGVGAFAFTGASAVLRGFGPPAPPPPPPPSAMVEVPRDRRERRRERKRSQHHGRKS